MTLRSVSSWPAHNVRFTPKSGHVRRTRARLLWAKSGHRAVDQTYDNAALTGRGINPTKRGRRGAPRDRRQSVQIGFDRHDVCAEADIIHL